MASGGTWVYVLRPWSFIFASRIKRLPPLEASAAEFCVGCYGTFIMSQADLHVPYFPSSPWVECKFLGDREWVFVPLYHQHSLWPILSRCLWTGLKCQSRQEGFSALEKKIASWPVTVIGIKGKHTNNRNGLDKLYLIFMHTHAYICRYMYITIFIKDKEAINLWVVWL